MGLERAGWRINGRSGGKRGQSATCPLLLSSLRASLLLQRPLFSRPNLILFSGSQDTLEYKIAARFPGMQKLEEKAVIFHRQRKLQIDVGLSFGFSFSAVHNESKQARESSQSLVDVTRKRRGKCISRAGTRRMKMPPRSIFSTNELTSAILTGNKSLDIAKVGESWEKVDG